MRILSSTSRFPEFAKRGDQSRAFAFLSFLAERHDVTVVSASPPSCPRAARELDDRCEVLVRSVGRAERGLSAVSAAAAGQPSQVGWMMPAATWRMVVERSQAADVVLINTLRSVRGALSVPMVIDYVDALSWNMRARSRGPESLPIRAFARIEAAFLQRWERRVDSWAGASIVTSSGVAAVLPNPHRHTVIPVPWTEGLTAPEEGRRDIDLIMTGDMRYPPNREGARVLAREILPLVRRELPASSCWVVGRHAEELRLEGVELRENVPDIGAYLRRSKVAVAPVTGRGSPYKVLEAAANGAAVVAHPWALDAYGLQGDETVDPESFADACIRLLTDEGQRRRRAGQGARAVRERGIETLGTRYEAVLAAAAETGQSRSTRS